MFPLSVKFLNCTPFAMMEHQHFLGNQDSVLYRFIIFPPRLSQAKHSTTRGLGHCIKRHNPLCRNHHEKLYLISIFFPVVILPSQIPSFWDSGIFISKSLHAFSVFCCEMTAALCKGSSCPDAKLRDAEWEVSNHNNTQ